jgi:hypothetical protein
MGRKCDVDTPISARRERELRETRRSRLACRFAEGERGPTMRRMTIIIIVGLVVAVSLLAVVVFVLRARGHKHDCTEPKDLADRGHPSRRWFHGALAVYKGDCGDPGYWDYACAKRVGETRALASAGNAPVDGRCTRRSQQGCNYDPCGSVGNAVRCSGGGAGGCRRPCGCTSAWVDGEFSARARRTSPPGRARRAAYGSPGS